MRGEAVPENVAVRLEKPPRAACTEGSALSPPAPRPRSPASLPGLHRLCGEPADPWGLFTTALPVPSVPEALHQISQASQALSLWGQANYLSFSSPSFPDKDKEAEGGRSIFYCLFTQLKGRAACLKKDDGGFPVNVKNTT